MVITSDLNVEISCLKILSTRMLPRWQRLTVKGVSDAKLGRDLVSWTDEQWPAVQEAVEKALARTAKCRQVIHPGPT